MNFSRKFRLDNLLPYFVDFLLENVAFAQFGLDDAHLFAQVDFALAAIHLLLHLALISSFNSSMLSS